MGRWRLAVAILATLGCAGLCTGCGSSGGTSGGDGGPPVRDGGDIATGPELGGGDAAGPRPDGEAPDTAADAGGGDAGAPACTDGTVGCLSETRPQTCIAGTWRPGNECPAGAFCRDGACATPADCTPGAVVGCDGLASLLVCVAAGDAVVSEPCPDQQQCVLGACTAVVCTPGIGECASSSTVRICLGDGSGYGDPVPCEAGTTCTAGRCLNLCEADIKQNTNVGCEYWSVDLDNDPTHNPALPNQPTPEMFPHSVVISNPNDSPVTVTFSLHVACADGSACAPGLNTCNGQPNTVCDGPADGVVDLAIADPLVPAHESREFKMPVLNVHGSVITRKAIRVLASRPVVAYQFNPFNSENASSNDGSLLLPRNALGQLYFAVSLPSRAAINDFFGNPLFPENNGFLTVVAMAAGTTVRVTPTIALIANPAGGVPQDGSTPATLAAGQTYEFVLDAYDVLNLEQLASGGIIPPGTYPEDLTGTRIEADQMVVVFSGHQVAGLQERDKLTMTDVWDSCCTEHLEEQLMPVETWGTRAHCVKSVPRGYEADRWVVVAGEDGVTLTTDPVIDRLNGVTLARAGDHVIVETQESFELTATGRIQVVQFLMSQGQTYPIGQGTGIGDPSMLIVPPSEQYRDEYGILTAAGYGMNWTTVIRPAGEPVQVDGIILPDASFEPLGSGAFEYAYHEVANGPHTFASAAPFGLMVYGYGTVTAYGYPGGMLLER